jgi:short-subunit dehydrogenase
MSGRYALVTGGSTGIGAAIARALAARGANLVLVARNEQQLDEVAAEIRSAQTGVAVLTIAIDLAEPGAVRRLLAAVDEAGIELELLVNSAGMSSRGLVVESDPAVLRHLVDLNVGALTELTTAVAAQMSTRGHGSIVNIASTGAYAPAPVLAAYAASKAYVLSFTQALWAETKDKNIRVVAVSPGPTQTPMNASAGRGKRQPAQVAETVLAALDGSDPAVVDGHRNTLTAGLIRLLPTRLITGLALRTLSS